MVPQVRASLRGPPCAHGVAGTPQGEVHDRDFVLCRPCDGHRLPVWLGRPSSTVDLSPGSNYGTFVVEWWTPMYSKELKSLVAREC